jgi:LCP family protein required for cell wall assembly
MSDKEIKPEPVEDYYNTIDEEPIVPVEPAHVDLEPAKRSKKRPLEKSIWLWAGVALAVFLLFFTPFRINFLILGIDPNDQHSAQGRSDTMILTTIPPVSPYLRMLSIPRDLWVEIPGHGQNRINTAHYFAEVAKKGSGPQAAAETVEQNFHVSVPYTLRIQVDGFIKIVDAMGGVTVDLPTAMSGYTAGVHHLDAKQALTLVRDRKGSDDFYRQMRGQIFIKGAIKQMLNPLNWWRIPGVVMAFTESITTNIPVYLWPRIGYSVLFSGAVGFDSHTLDHNMVNGWITNEGADVLLPNWDRINPLVEKLFK